LIGGVLSSPDAIVTIHGGTHRDERRRLQTLFRSDPDVRVLVSTDAAGEGRRMLAGQAPSGGDRRKDLASQP
jgi:hypothetical protein